MPFIGAPRRPEIDNYTIKFLIGAIALSLPLIEFALTRGSITSISASFWFEPGVWPRSVLVGFLFAITAFLLAYNGTTETEMWLGKGASLAAAGIALFPCGCGNPEREIIPHVHSISTGVMFGVLSGFCWIFLRRAWAKGHPQAKARATIYALCGLGMIGSILLFIASAIKNGEALIFWAETVGLVSFGISWLTASHVIPVITRSSERQMLFVVSKT